MNIKEIQDLIKFVVKSGANEVQIEDKEFKILIKSTSKGKDAETPVVTPIVAIPQIQPVPVASTPVETHATMVAEQKAVDESKYITVKSPMIGTFYRSSAPDKAPFVNIGDEIKQGKVICIIEAMKLFNEIESEVNGKIVKILVENATPVEYDQPLFLVEPN